MKLFEIIASFVLPGVAHRSPFCHINVTKKNLRMKNRRRLTDIRVNSKSVLKSGAYDVIFGRNVIRTNCRVFRYNFKLGLMGFKILLFVGSLFLYLFSTYRDSTKQEDIERLFQQMIFMIIMDCAWFYLVRH